MNLEQIDTSTTAGKAEVMRMAAEGRRVAARWHGREANAWWSPDRPEWDWTKSDYAIIAEPVGPDEVWSSFGKGGGVAAIYVSKPMVYQGASLVRYVRAD